jgi:hypothetical protein
MCDVTSSASCSTPALFVITFLSLYSGAGAVENYIAHIGSASLLSFKQFNALNKVEQTGRCSNLRAIAIAAASICQSCSH